MKNDLIQTEIRQEPDGRISFTRRAQMGSPSYLPKGLIRYPPKWAQTLIEHGTTFVEFVQAVGEAARQAQTRAQRRSVFRVVEQLALSDEGRQTIDQILTPGFIHWLTAVTGPLQLAFFAPPSIVYENANSPGKGAWLGSWEDEDVWPVAMLQTVTLDQAISAVWQDNYRPFVELFLFDGLDLQGRLLRIVRVSTEVTPLQLRWSFPNGYPNQVSLNSARLRSRNHRATHGTVTSSG